MLGRSYCEDRSMRFWIFLCLVLFSGILGADDVAEELSVASLQKRITELESENTNLKRLYTSCSQQVNIAHRKRSKNEELLREAERKYADLEESNKASLADVSRLQQELAELKVQLKATETQLRELEKAKPATDAPKEVPPANDHTLFVDDLIRERDRQRILVNEEAEEANNGPKDITLFCSSSPQVRIVDLDQELVNKNVCL